VAARPEVFVSCRIVPGRFQLARCAKFFLLCLHQSTAPIVCASRIVTGGLLLVTMRTMLQASTSYTVLLQVTIPSDEPSGASNVQPRNAVRPSARSQTGVVSSRAQPAHPRARTMAQFAGSPSHRRHHRSQRHVSGRQAANNDTNREWCPESLVALVLLRQARRTATLT